MRKDTWHWLLSFDPKDGRVLWVDEDYQIYADPAPCFDLTRELLAQIENANVYE